jgi:hypothetical protein
MDCYITINDVTYLDPDVNVKYCVFKDSINFIVQFNYNNEYYGYSEFKYKI